MVYTIRRKTVERTNCMNPAQATFDEQSITREEWSWVEALIRDVKREEDGAEFCQTLFQWDLAVRQFRRTEQKRLVLASPTPTDLEFHATCLHALLAVGHALMIHSRDFKPEDLAAFKIKHEEVEAYVQDLEQSYREWHHGFSNSELEKARQSIFCGKA